MVAAVALISAPACIGISAVADPVVRLILGLKWLPVIPLVQVLSLFATTAVIGAMSYNLMTVYGLLTVQFRITLAGAVVRVITLLLWVPRFGVMGAILAVGAGIAVEYTAYLVVTCRRFSIAGVDLGRQLWRVALGSAAMSALLAGTGLGWAPGTAGGTLEVFRVLAEAMVLGALTYGAVVLGAWVAAGRPAGAETDLWALLRKRAPAASPL